MAGDAQSDARLAELRQLLMDKDIPFQDPDDLTRLVAFGYYNANLLSAATKEDLESRVGLTLALAGLLVKKFGDSSSGGPSTSTSAASAAAAASRRAGDESTSGREKAAGGVVYVQVILRQAGQPVKVQLASEEEAEAAAPLNGSEVACVSELTLQTLKVPPPPATSAVYVDPGGNSLPVHIRLPATEQEYLALPPQLISDNSRDKPLRLIVCKSGFAMGMVRDIQSAIAAVVQDFTAGIKGMFVAVNNTHPKRD